MMSLRFLSIAITVFGFPPILLDKHRKQVPPRNARTLSLSATILYANSTDLIPRFYAVRGHEIRVLQLRIPRSSAFSITPMSSSLRQSVHSNVRVVVI